VIGHPPGNLLSLTLGVRLVPPFFLRNHSTRSSARVFQKSKGFWDFFFSLHPSIFTLHPLAQQFVWRLLANR